MRRLLGVLAVVCVVACGSKPDPVKQAADRVRAEFTKRLVAYQGELESLEITPAGVSAKWKSNQCDMIAGEVIDFLISLHRGHPDTVFGTITGERACGGTSRVFKTAAGQFDQYRAGKISDTVVLSGLQ